MSLTVTFNSVTLSPVMVSTRSEIMSRTCSTSSRMFLPYSTPIVRSTAVSNLPTSAEMPRVCPCEPATLSRIRPAVRETLPPMRMPSTSPAATPAILETTPSLIVVVPRSLWSGLSIRCRPCSVIFPFLLCQLFRLSPDVSPDVPGETLTAKRSRVVLAKVGSAVAKPSARNAAFEEGTLHTGSYSYSSGSHPGPAVGLVLRGADRKPGRRRRSERGRLPRSCGILRSPGLSSPHRPPHLGPGGRERAGVVTEWGADGSPRVSRACGRVARPLGLRGLRL